MKVGALEARRWAGLVFAAGPGEGVGLRLAFTDAESGRRHDWDDWYSLVSKVGEHAPDGSYARMEFDTGGGSAGTRDRPGAPATPASTLVWEWSRRNDALALRATTTRPGALELIGDAPWGWTPRWREAERKRRGARDGPEADAAWLAKVGQVEVAAAFSAGCRRLRQPADGQTGQWMAAGAGTISLSPGSKPGAPGGHTATDSHDSCGPVSPSLLRAVVAWGSGAAARAGRLLDQADDWLGSARSDWAQRRPASSGACEGLVESIADNLMWTVLLQPETARLYTPAGRRWIFPKPAPAAPARREADDWTTFGWDSFFNALQLSVVSKDLAWAALLAGIRSRYPNGNVPNWRSRHGGTPDRSQPPVGSFAALKLHLAHPCADSLRAAYSGLLEWSDFWVAPQGARARREGLTPGLLSWGSDTELLSPRPPPWEAGASGRQRAAWESGQDDLPLWEEAGWDPDRRVLAMSAADLCSYRALDLECLSRIARILGDGENATRLSSSYRQLAEKMNQVLWSDDVGLYLDELPSGHSSRVAASNFLPLAAGIPSAAQAHRMIKVLQDPRRFWGDWILPTISRDDPAFADQQYWRGSIWPPMNYLVLQGLRRYGYHELAAELAWKSAAMFLADRHRTGSCRENFDSRTGEGCGRRFQSWGPLFALGALEQFVDVTHWGGLRIGSLLPRGTLTKHVGRDAGVTGILAAGHRWTVQLRPNGFGFQTESFPWTEVTGATALHEVAVERNELRARAPGAGALLRTGSRTCRPDAEGSILAGV